MQGDRHGRCAGDLHLHSGLGDSIKARVRSLQIVKADVKRRKTERAIGSAGRIENRLGGFVGDCDLSALYDTAALIDDRTGKNSFIGLSARFDQRTEKN